MLRRWTSSRFSQTHRRYFSKKNKTDSQSKYTDTISLPETRFPSWISNSNREALELDVQKKCQFSSLYSWQEQLKDRPPFVLHDGPPYANGSPHMGHAVNKILKDIINRYKLLSGYRIHYVPGWDCHGLPIELKAVNTSEEKNLSPLEVRAKARKFALKALDGQKSAFKRWGVMANWDNCYLTFNKEYVQNQWQAFWSLYEKGLIFRSLKPVYWSPALQTALAEAELEYNPDHKSTSIFIRFLLKKIPSFIQSHIGVEQPVYALVWTTTPWTLPANKFVSYSSQLSYSLVRCETSGDYYIIASELRDDLEQQLSKRFNIETSFSGELLNGTTYIHPLERNECPFLSASFVKYDKGTGLVHSSPDHGFDDFYVASEFGIPLKNCVDESGRFTASAGQLLEGKFVLQEGTEILVKHLAKDILQEKEFTHNYPYDWRLRKPVIVRPSMQWFIDTDKLKDRALNCLRNIEIIPANLAKNMEWQLHKRPYWCISRQRVWGTPVPAFYEKESKKTILTRSLVDHWCGLIDANDTDMWWKVPDETLLPAEILKNEGFNLANEYEKGNDILDIWFDSGISWKCVLKDVNYKADLCLEGLDQSRGWFQALLLTGVALQNEAPFKKLFFHGFTLDKNNKKMSKSLGNVLDPDVIVNGGSKMIKTKALGADTLRWWVASHAVGDMGIHISPAVLQEISEFLQKLRKTFWFLLGTLNDFSPEKDLVEISQMNFIDKIILHRLFNFQTKILQFYSTFRFNTATALITNFVVNDISALYLHATKTRSYCSDRNSLERKAVQTSCYYLLIHLGFAVAPILPHLGEEVFSHASFLKNSRLFHHKWPECLNVWSNEELNDVLETILSMKNDIDKEVSDRNLSSQMLDLHLHGSPALISMLKMSQLENYSCYSDLCDIMQVASVTLNDKVSDADTYRGSSKVIIESTSDKHNFVACLTPTEKVRCERCRRFVADKENDICTHCSLTINARKLNVNKM